MLVMEEELKGGYKPKLERFVSLSDNYRDEESMRELMDGLGNRAHKQLELLMHFLRLAGFPMEMGFEIKQGELMKQAESSPAVLKALSDKGVFFITKKSDTFASFKYDNYHIELKYNKLYRFNIK